MVVNVVRKGSNGEFRKVHYVGVPTISIKYNVCNIYNSLLYAFHISLLLDNKLMWKAYSRELATKLNKACYAIRAVKSLVSLKALISIYFSYSHSLLMYGIIFWGNSPVSKDIFKIQKRAIRIITNKCRREFCKQIFKRLKILTLPSQYIFSVLVFVV